MPLVVSDSRVDEKRRHEALENMNATGLTNARCPRVERARLESQRERIRQLASAALGINLARWIMREISRDKRTNLSREKRDARTRVKNIRTANHVERGASFRRPSDQVSYGKSDVIRIEIVILLSISISCSKPALKSDPGVHVNFV